MKTCILAAIALILCQACTAQVTDTATTTSPCETAPGVTCGLEDGGSFPALSCPSDMPQEALTGCTGAGGPGVDPQHVTLCCMGAK